MFIVKGIFLYEEEIKDFNLNRLKLDYFWIEDKNYFVVGETIYKGNVDYPGDMTYKEAELEPSQHLVEQLARIGINRPIKLHTFLIY